MNTSIEDRLRAHFADRTAKETFASEPPSSSPQVDHDSPHRRAPLVLAAAAVFAIAGAVGAILITRDDNPRKIDVIAPDTTTSIAPTTTLQSPSTTIAPATTTTDTAPPADASMVRSVVISTDGVLGSWNGSRWVPSVEGVPAKGGETYTIVGVDHPSS